jgi:cell division transport system permease protein
MNTALRTSAADRRLLPEGRLAGPMPWVIAIMTFLTVLAAGAGLALGNAASGLGDQLAGKLTIQIVEPNPDSRDRQTRTVLAELARLGSVAQASRVDEARMRELLSPWLGQDGLDADLPVPSLIDVSLRANDPDPRSISELTATVKAVAPSARVDADSQWMGPLQGLLSTLRWLSVALVALMAATMAAAVVLAARTALVTHRSTIDIMHLMGATDVQVARLFQRRAALDALFGSLLGCVCGALVVFGVGGRIANVGAALLDKGGLGLTGWLVIALLPIAAVLLSIITARLTVVRALARML